MTDWWGYHRLPSLTERWGNHQGEKATPDDMFIVEFGGGNQKREVTRKEVADVVREILRWDKDLILIHRL